MRVFNNITPQNYYFIALIVVIGLFLITPVNAGFNYCQNFTIHEMSNFDVINKPIEYNFTNLTNKMINNNDFRIRNASSNETATYQPYDVIDNTSTSIRAIFQINLTSAITLNWSYCWNDSTLNNPNYNVLTHRDSFEGANYNNSYWTLSDNDPSNSETTSSDYSKYGAKSLKMYTSGEYYHRLNHAESSTVGTWTFVMRESGTIQGNVESGLMFVSASETKYMRFSRFGVLSTTNYLVQDNVYYTLAMAKVITGNWYNHSFVINETGAKSYIENQNIRNYSALVSLETTRLQVSGVQSTDYFDEYRFYANVFDRPDQKYEIKLTYPDLNCWTYQISLKQLWIPAGCLYFKNVEYFI